MCIELIFKNYMNGQDYLGDDDRCEDFPIYTHQQHILFFSKWYFEVQKYYRVKLQYYIEPHLSGVSVSKKRI